MATFYVDYVGGADSNVGTDSGHAWKHCPGDVNATGLEVVGDYTFEIVRTVAP
jgi:hypothetical protein